MSIPPRTRTHAHRRPGNRLIALLVLMTSLLGCATNPVTGRNELALLGPDWERGVGASQYGPSQQMQGGRYTVDADLTAYVSEVGARVAAHASRAFDYEFTVLNSSTPNAWALPGGKIAINRGLLTELENEAELAAVLGHEVVHADARHGAQAMERGLLAQGALVATAIGAGGTRYQDVILQGAQVGAQLVQQRYGREAERESDLYGMRYMQAAGYDPRAAITLQEKFVKLAGDRRPGWLEGLFASHPPSQERVEKNRETAAALPPGGELGRERYQRMIARLAADAPAYAAHDAGRRALAKGDVDTALTRAREAIRLVPEEPTFHALLGDAQLARRRSDAALSAFDRAVELDPQFFYHHLQRGRTLASMNREPEARQALETSQALLPTTAAANALGTLALRAGDTATAEQWFTAAAQADTAEGRAAARQLALIWADTQPERALAAEVRLNQTGAITIMLTNRTATVIEAPRIGLVFRSGGRTMQRRLAPAGRLAPGQTATVDSGIDAASVDPGTLRAIVQGYRVP